MNRVAFDVRLPPSGRVQFEPEIWLFNASESNSRTLWSRFSPEIAHDVRPLLRFAGLSEPIACP